MHSWITCSNGYALFIFAHTHTHTQGPPAPSGQPGPMLCRSPMAERCHPFRGRESHLCVCALPAGGFWGPWGYIIGNVVNIDYYTTCERSVCVAVCGRLWQIYAQYGVCNTVYVIGKINIERIRQLCDAQYTAETVAWSCSGIQYATEKYVVELRRCRCRRCNIDGISMDALFVLSLLFMCVVKGRWILTM